MTQQMSEFDFDMELSRKKTSNDPFRLSKTTVTLSDLESLFASQDTHVIKSTRSK